MLNFFKRKTLGTTQEQIAEKIVKELSNLSYPAKDEILKIVIKNSLPDKHLKYRPAMKRTSTSWRTQP